MNADDVAHWEKFINATPEQREEMSDEDVLCAAVNVVANKLHSEGKQILQASCKLMDTPNIWFRKDDTTQYVVITCARYPRDAEPPQSSSQIHQNMVAEGYTGFWVGVSLANEYEAFDPESDEGLALMKGFGLFPKIGVMVPMSDLDR